MHPKIKHLCNSLAVLALFAGAANGGALLTDGNASIQGSKLFSGGNVLNQTLIASVEYAVYAPGDFGTSVALGLPALADPSGGAEYVYAYEIFNDVGGQLRVAALSIALNPGVITNIATNVSHAPGTPEAGLAPNAWTFIPIAVDPPSNVKWSYTVSPNLLTVGLHSDILLFTSPFGPTFLNASMTGGSASSAPKAGDPAVLLPSPIPEPSTLVLSALAAGLLAAGYLRRRKV
ncbi:MAG: PEP-CTERM sorting domain-containing protein [Pirellulales bacterium]